MNTSPTVRDARWHEGTSQTAHGPVKDTHFGPIPDDWEVRHLGDVADIISGATPSTTNPSYWNGGIKWCTPTDITGTKGRYLVETERTISQKGLNNCSARLLPPGTLLLCSRATIGEVRIAATAICTNQGFKSLVCRDSVNNEFLYYAVLTMKPRMIARAIGSTFLELSKSDAASLEFVCPPRSEQNLIASALSATDAQIGSLDRLVAKKIAIKHAAMQQLLSGKTRLKGFASKWENKKLGELLYDCWGGSTPSRARPEFFRGTIPWITSGELEYGLITDTKEKITNEAMREANLKLLPAGTFLMAITGMEAEGTRGACGIVGVEATTNQSCMALMPNDRLLSSFLFHWYVHNGKALALQYCQGTKQQSYTAGIVRELPISLPADINEQREIAGILSDMDTELGALNNRFSKVLGIKQAMMQALLTGRVRLIKPEVTA